jgi:hypothetical protein
VHAALDKACRAQQRRARLEREAGSLAAFQAALRRPNIVHKHLHREPPRAHAHARVRNRTNQLNPCTRTKLSTPMQPPPCAHEGTSAAHLHPHP